MIKINAEFYFLYNLTSSISKSYSMSSDKAQLCTLQKKIVFCCIANICEERVLNKSKKKMKNPE